MHRRGRRRPRPAARSRRPISSGSSTTSSVCGGGGTRRAAPSRARRELDALPAVAAARLRGPATGDRGPQASPKPENELAAMVRQGRRVIVTFPHQGEALRTQRAAPEGRDRSFGTTSTPCRREPSARIRRQPGSAAASSGATSASRCFPTRRSSASAPAGRRAARPRAPVVRRPARRRLRRARGSRRRASCSASRRRTSLGSPATTSSSRSAARTGSTSRTSRSRKVSRYIGADAQVAGALEARRQGVAEPRRAARARPCESSPASCSRSTRSASAAGWASLDL